MPYPSHVNPLTAALGINRVQHSRSHRGNVGTEYRIDMKCESQQVRRKGDGITRQEKILFEQGISSADRRATGEQKKGLEKFSKPLTTWYAWRDSNPRPSDSKSGSSL